MQLGDFLNNLAKQCSIPATDPGLISLLSNAAISTANISDDFTNKLQNGLLTNESAKNDPELKRYFTALALNALDSELNNLTTEFEIPDDIKAELSAEKSSYKRAALLARKVKELESKKITATKGDKDKLAEQIDALNNELATIKTNSLKEKNDLIERHKSERIDWELNNHYNGYNYATQLSKEANIKLAQSLISDQLSKEGLKIENADGNLRLVTKEGTDYYQNNQKVTVKDYIDKALTTHKVIAIEDKTKNQQQNQQQNFNQQQHIPAKKSKAFSVVDAMLNEDMASIPQ